MTLVLSPLWNSLDIRKLDMSRLGSGYRQPLTGLLRARLTNLSQSVDRFFSTYDGSRQRGSFLQIHESVNTSILNELSTQLRRTLQTRGRRVEYLRRFRLAQ